MHVAPIANIHIAVPDKKYRFTVGMAQQSWSCRERLRSRISCVRSEARRIVYYFPG